MTKTSEHDIGFALCHGWGFDARALAPLRAALSHRFPTAPCVTFDLGFGGAAHTPLLSADTRWIAVGHSYGFAWLMQQPVAWQGAVAINGFTRFCRRIGQSQGTPPRLLDAMIARLADDPGGTVQDFYLRCGATSTPPPQPDQSALSEHLTRLRDIDITLPDCPTLALATAADAIVSLALARACFAQASVDLRELDGDHTRLLREPDLTVELIAAWMEAVRG